MADLGGTVRARPRSCSAPDVGSVHERGDVNGRAAATRKGLRTPNPLPGALSPASREPLPVLESAHSLKIKPPSLPDATTTEAPHTFPRLHAGQLSGRGWRIAYGVLCHSYAAAIRTPYKLAGGERAPRTSTGRDDHVGDAVFVPVCMTCGRFVKADETVLVGEGGLHPGPNATCKNCGRTRMPFEGFF